MTELDDALVPATLALIDDFGLDMTFTETEDNYDPDTGTNPVTSPTTFVRKASPPLEYNLALIDGDNIREGDARIFVAASGITAVPGNGWKVEFDSTTWRIVNRITHQSGASVAAYEFRIRR